jgi:hypothetical protein
MMKNGVNVTYDGKVMTVRYELIGHITMDGALKNVLGALDYFAKCPNCAAYKFVQWNRQKIYEMVVYRPVAMGGEVVVTVPETVIEQVRNG